MAFSGYIPEELILDLLKRLPMKALGRFLSVSHSWSCLISSPCFSETHRSRNPDEPTTYLRQDRVDDKMCIFHLQDKTIIQKLVFPSPVRCHPWRKSGTSLLEVIHGVVCYTYSDLSDYIVFWNPAINKHVWAPLPPEDRFQTLAAGFDASNNDFKAVCIPYKVKEGSYYQVFSARTGSWTQRKCLLYQLPFSSFTGGCFFDGAIYWVGASRELVYFDCQTELFGRMELPEEVNGLQRMVVYQGFLTLITNDTQTTPTVWRMKKLGFWTKNSTVTHNVLGAYTCIFKESMLLLDIGQPCRNWPQTYADLFR